MSAGPTKAQFKAAQKALETARGLAEWYVKFKPGVNTLTFSPEHYKAIHDCVTQAVGAGTSHLQVWLDAEGNMRAQLAGNVWKINRQGE